MGCGYYFSLFFPQIFLPDIFWCLFKKFGDSTVKEKSSNAVKVLKESIKKRLFPLSFYSTYIWASKSLSKDPKIWILGIIPDPSLNCFFVVNILGFLVNDPLCQERPAPDHDNDCCVQVVCASETSKEISSSPTISVSKNRWKKRNLKFWFLIVIRIRIEFEFWVRIESESNLTWVQIEFESSSNPVLIEF